MSGSEQKSLLRVTSEDSAAFITVVDRKFNPLAEGYGEVELRVAPGLYEARFEAGASVREQLLSLQPDENGWHVREDKITFATPAPLAVTRSDIPQQSRAARQVSRKVHRTVGNGGQLMIFVRDLDLRARSTPTHGLSVLGPEGERLDPEQDGLHGGGEIDDRAPYPPWAGCNYQLDPGRWILRSPTRAGGAVEQAIAVCDGWQTQVFLERGPSRFGRTRRPNLADAAVLMAGKGTGFDPRQPDLRAAELARQGLRDRRFAIDEKELESMLAGKPRNPMLAIYGAHLLIHRSTEDRDVRLIRRVSQNLRGLVGEHPDVRAIELWLGEDDVGDFAEPPMLKSSWSIIVQESAGRPELVPRGSRSAAIAESVLAGGPWLRWRAAHATRPPAPASTPAGALGEALAEVAAALPEDPRVVLEQVNDATPAESSVISLAHQAGEEASAISDSDILKRLRIPRTVAEDTVGALLDRLNERS